MRDSLGNSLMSESSYHDGSEADASTADRPRNAASRTTSRLPSRSIDRKRSRSRSAAASAKRRLTGYVKNNYIQLLDQTIDNTQQRDSVYLQSLPPSQIGASFWTSDEKHVFFQTLDRCGPGDMHTLAKAVSSKSELEVHVYLKLLQAGAAEADLPFNHRDVPAAAEISSAYEAVLERTADTLSFRVDQDELESAYERSGKHVLITGDVAELYESRCEDTTEDAAAGLERLAAESQQSNVSVSPNDAPIRKNLVQARASPDVDLPTSVRFLSPLAFLNLSDRIFMNGPLGSGRNWREFIFADEHVSEPCIRQEALDDFYTIVISLTRRIMQSAIFQAMSRLRAMDANRKNYTPVFRVTNVDVNAATDMLGLKKDRMQYWAMLPRSYHLDVYSDSKKYDDGRLGSTNGRKLNLEEAERELGLHLPTAMDEPVSDVEFDDDDWTSADSDSTSSKRALDDVQRGQDGGGGSPLGAHKIEDEYLEALDLQHSREEEELLWAAVHGRTATKRPKIEADIAVPNGPRLPVEKAPVLLWRDRVEYEPQWVTVEGLPRSCEFQGMKARSLRKSELKQELLEEIRSAGHEYPLVGEKIVDESAEESGLAEHPQSGDEELENELVERSDFESDDSDGDEGRHPANGMMHIGNGLQDRSAQEGEEDFSEELDDDDNDDNPDNERVHDEENDSHEQG